MIEQRVVLPPSSAACALCHRTQSSARINLATRVAFRAPAFGLVLEAVLVTPVGVRPSHSKSPSVVVHGCRVPGTARKHRPDYALED